ncbi:MAG: hypothetical protein JNK04_10255 [Myxococcales bacterium]|nr:hypothetical protein [Myxococcales bacterium]
MRALFAAAFALALTGCGGDGATGGAPAGGADAGGAFAGGASAEGGAGGEGGAPDVDEAAGCVDTFGDALTDDFARLDGTIVALVKPSDTQCPTVNDDHAILEVEMSGAIYRLVINVGAPGDPLIRYAVIEHDMPMPAFEEGWHVGVQLDYPISFDMHAEEDFDAVESVTLAQSISDEMIIGAKVSIYATSSGGSSAHLIHRNGNHRDGAIFVAPDSEAPRVLLFHFDNQTF